MLREEKETIILFNEAEPTATCFTYNVRMINRLARISEERPEECSLVMENDAGAVEYEFPKSWVRVTPARKYTDEQRIAMAERLRPYSR